MHRMVNIFSIIVLGPLLGFASVWNNPHAPSHTQEKIFYSSFGEQPKTLDPARSYSADEWVFIAQTYEPPLQYHYLLRPYHLIPLTASELPKITFLNQEQLPLPKTVAPQVVAFTKYQMSIRPGIYYQPHPALAKDATGKYLYLSLSPETIAKKYELSDFPQTGTREVTAEDFVYQIKRIADPRVMSPIYGLMSQYIVGFKAFNQRLLAAEKNLKPGEFFDLRQYPLDGVKIIDKYHYDVLLNGDYPQFRYWLAMYFFSPIPWEADKFYSQAGMQENNLSFDWYPIGTGAFMLTKNNPNRQMVLTKNPNFHGETYPEQGMPDDEAKGLLAAAGKSLPFIDKAIFSLEKESIPRWNKFLQGYYDNSAISSDSFDQAIRFGAANDAMLTEDMKAKGIRLTTSVGVTIFYLGFNMLDKVVGGYSIKQQKLRQAISIAVNYEEYIAIFLNGRGFQAQGPIPPGIFGYEEGKPGIDPYVYTWHGNRGVRRSIAYAKRLLAEAGYPNGINPATGKQLVLNYDVPESAGPDSKDQFNWMRKQFSKIGIELNIRGTQYNRFQQKMLKGNAQIFFWGWNADYPDPENFLIGLYGPSSKVKYGGENAANYENPKYDKLFEKMRAMPDSSERLRLIRAMLEIVRKDSPWVWGFYPKNYTLTHDWVKAGKPSDMGLSTLKYSAINDKKRDEMIKQWNQPIIWPLFLLLAGVLLLMVPVAVRFWQKEYSQKG